MQAKHFKSIYLDNKYYLVGFFFFLIVLVLSPDFLFSSKLFFIGTF